MRKYSVIIILMLLTAGYTSAQNFNDALRLSVPGLGSDARALGMGNAYGALGYGFAGAMFNPAGLGFSRTTSFEGSLLYNSFNNNAGFYGNTEDYSNSVTNLSQAGFVFPMPTMRGSLVFALGFNQYKNFNSAVKFDAFNPTTTSMIQHLTGPDDISYQLYLTDESGTQTPINGRLNQSGDIIEEGKINKWSLSGAVEVAKNVFFGVGLNIITGDYRNDRRYYEDDTRNIYGNNVLTDPATPETADFQTFFLNDIIEWDLSGWDAKVGFIYKLPHNFHFGASIKFPSQFTVKENYYVNGSSEFGTGTTYTLDQIKNQSEYDITTPYEFNGALAYSMTGLSISADVTYIDYTQMEFTDGLGQSQVSRNNKQIKDLMRGVVNYNVGLEYRLPYIPFTVRGGFIMMPSAFKDDPGEYDRKYFTAGLGISTNNALMLDIAYAHGWWKNISDNYGAGVSRVYHDVTSNNFIFSVKYLFN